MDWVLGSGGREKIIRIQKEPGNDGRPGREIGSLQVGFLAGLASGSDSAGSVIRPIAPGVTASDLNAREQRFAGLRFATAVANRGVRRFWARNQFRLKTR